MAIQARLDSVGLRLRHARKLRKLNQEQLAKLAGVKQPSISEIETGETKEITGPNLLKICKALHVRPEWLLTGEDPIEPLPAEDLTNDERELLAAYRGATAQWKLSIRYMARMQHDKQREKAAAYVLSSIFATPVPDERLGDDWTRPDKK